MATLRETISQGFPKWYELGGDYHTLFTYDPEANELWDELNDPFGMPIATPSTLAEARAIIEKQGHTIS